MRIDDPEAVAVRRLRRRRAVALREAGMTYGQIGRLLGNVTGERARALVREGYELQDADSVDIAHVDVAHEVAWAIRCKEWWRIHRIHRALKHIAEGARGA